MKYAFLALAAVLLCVNQSSAAVKYWDINGATPGAGGATPAGNWNTSTANWSTDPTGSTAATTFTSATDSAVFAAGIDASGSYTVTIPSAITAASVAVEEGTVTLTTSGALTTQAITISNGGALFTKSALGLVASPGASITLNGGTMGNSNTTTGGSFLSSGTTNSNMGIVLGTGGGHVSANGGAAIVSIYTGLISGTGPLTVDGSGIFRLTTTTATYSGATNINGTLQISTTANVLPSGTDMTINSGGKFDQQANQTVASLSGSGALAFTNTGTTLTVSGSTDTSYSGAVTGVGGITKAGVSTLTLSGANSYSGATNVSNGILSVASLNKVSGGSATSSLGHPTTAANGTIGLGATGTTGTLSYTGTGETTDRVINLAGTTGGGAIDQSGTGNLKFTSNFTASGAGTKTLTLKGSMAGTGEIAGAIVNNSSTNKTSVAKSGSGTWVLSGASTYSGGTTISAGTLLANNTTGSATGTAVVTVNGGVFGGTGTVTGGVNVNNGGTLSPGTVTPGASIGTLAIGALTFASGSTFHYEVDTTSPVNLAAAGDVVKASGDLTIASGALLSLTDASLSPTTMPVGTRLTMIAYSGNWISNGTFSGEADDSVISLGGDFYVINYNDISDGTSNYSGPTVNAVTLTAVPEVNASLLGGLATLVVGVVIGGRKMLSKGAALA